MTSKHVVHIYATARIAIEVEGAATPQEAAEGVLADPATMEELQALPGYADDFDSRVLVDTLNEQGEVVASVEVDTVEREPTDPDSLSQTDLANLVYRIQRVLWGDGPDTQWDAETIERVAEVLEAAGLKP